MASAESIPQHVASLKARTTCPKPLGTSGPLQIASCPALQIAAKFIGGFAAAYLHLELGRHLARIYFFRLKSSYPCGSLMRFAMLESPCQP